MPTSGSSAEIERVVGSLKALAESIQKSKRISVRACFVGERAEPKLLKRALSRGVPSKIVDLCRVMDGFSLEWSATVDGAKKSGSVDLRSLAEHLGAHGDGVALDPEVEDALETTFLADSAPDGKQLCWIEGESGLWDDYNGVFEDGGTDLVSYLEAGVANLFVDGWFDHYLEHDEGVLHPDAITVREILG